MGRWYVGVFDATTSADVDDRVIVYGPFDGRVWAEQEGYKRSKRNRSFQSADFLVTEATSQRDAITRIRRMW